jgi:hypothetical protein
MEFEWDPSKAAENLRKHKVGFHEAATVFGDFFGTTASDPDHSAEERRSITVGLPSRGRVLMVAHAERGERIQIISARKLTGCYQQLKMSCAAQNRNSSRYGIGRGFNHGFKQFD